MPHASSNKEALLGDVALSPKFFPTVDTEIEATKALKLNGLSLFKAVNHSLYKLIDQAPNESFVLSAVIDFIDRVATSNVLSFSYKFAHFEWWLNQLSGLSDAENLRVRGKITGKFLPRMEFQSLFPIGMSTRHEGSHIVTAHLSPDLDTTVASFFGWLDAFSARVGTALHTWNVPGGEPSEATARLFKSAFGPAIFDRLPRKALALRLAGIDLLTQEGLVCEKGTTLTSSLDHNHYKNAIVLVDDAGYFVGEWRPSDVELVRQIIVPLKAVLRGFENEFHSKLMQLFAKKDVRKDSVELFLASLFEAKLESTAAATDLSASSRTYLERALRQYFKVDGLQATVSQFLAAISARIQGPAEAFLNQLKSLSSGHLFDKDGLLTLDRSILFEAIYQLFARLDEVVLAVSSGLDRLDVAISLKHDVLGEESHTVLLGDDIETIRRRMGSEQHVIVVMEDKAGRLIPCGCVSARQLRRQHLGTVSLRDFSNFDEIGVPDYLQVISIVDHHKTAIKTTQAACVVISDVQSCNVALAELAFALNDRYSLRGMTLEGIDKQIQEMLAKPMDHHTSTVMQALLLRRQAFFHRQNYYISADREYAECFFFLNAILDDTDLLTKLSFRDAHCVASLLNRMKSIITQRVVRVVTFDDILHAPDFAKLAGRRILTQTDMHSLYTKIYAIKEDEVDQLFEAAAAGKSDDLFADTKVQNGCARIGQIKMFSRNWPTFEKHLQTVRQLWLEASERTYQSQKEVQIYLQMNTTIAGAQETYEGKALAYPHQDQLWFGISDAENALDSLESFLLPFAASPAMNHGNLRLEYLGDCEDLRSVFSKIFDDIPFTTGPAVKGKSLVVLHYPAGALNSRKAMITPYLPNPKS